MVDRCLVITRDPALRREITDTLEGQAVHCVVVSSSQEAQAELADDRIGAVLVGAGDLRDDARSRLELRDLIEWAAPRPVLVAASEDQVDQAMSLLVHGVADVATRPIHAGLLRHRVQLAERRVRPPVSRPIPRRKSDVLMGNAAVMTYCRERIGMLAKTDLPVAVYGESGTGKELAGRMIHCESQRKRGPLVVANCAALPESLFENELFGHQRGSYTGAVGESAGLVEEARGGTLVLDEIGELSMPLQAKLLRLLQFGTYRRVGDSRTREADVRVICSTNRDLLEGVAASQFRQDLYYRINVLHVTMPPLREHMEDLPLLVDHILRTFCARQRRPLAHLDEAALALLRQHDWPGNVRELESVVLSALALSKGSQIHAEDIEIRFSTPTPPPSVREVAPSAPRLDSAGLGLSEARQRLVDSFERTYLEQLLERVRGNLSAAAREASTDRKSLWRLLRKHGIEAADYRRARG